MAPSTKLTAVLLLGLLLACGDGDKPGAASASAKPAGSTTTAASSASAPPKSDEIPPLTVDDLGIFLAGQRINLKEQDAANRLKKIVGELPIQGKEVQLLVLKKAKIPDVFALVREIGASQATSIRIKAAEGRGDLPKEFVIYPQAKLKDKPAACSIVGMVSKNLATDIWAVKGGTGKRHVKGFAGPDLSNTGETLQKMLKKCDSKVAFFSADDSLDWELAHMIGGAILANDTEKKISTLVLLDEVPVPGRPVKGFGD